MDFNKIKEMGLEYAEKGKNAALDLAEKGRTQAKIVNAQSKLYKAQRQLGALVYSLAKGNEENQPLVDKYIEMIANIEQELSDLKASLEPDTVIETTFEETEEAADDVTVDAAAEPAEEKPEDNEAKTCPQCGAPVSDDALFVLQQVRRTAVTGLRRAVSPGGMPPFVVNEMKILPQKAGKCACTLAFRQILRYNLNLFADVFGMRKGDAPCRTGRRGNTIRRKTSWRSSAS